MSQIPRPPTGTPSPVGPVPNQVAVVEVPAGGPQAPEPHPPGEPASARGSDHVRPVLAFFYPWYDKSAFQQPPMSDLPPDPYLSDDETVMRRQVSQAQTAAIDGFISSWAGIGDATDRNFARLLDRCPEGFSACAYFETALIKQAHLDIAAQVLHLHDQYMSHPRYLRVNGRPVVFFWAPKAIGAPAGRTSVDSWRTVRHTVDPGWAQFWNVETKDPEPWFEVFDGFHLFSAADWVARTPADYEPLLRTNVMFRQRVDGYNRRHGTARIFTAGVRPGYDDRFIRAQQQANDPTVPDGYAYDRVHGQYYLMSGQAAADSQPDQLAIVSFNEWFEGSQIEPSVTYGNLYLDLTPQIVDHYRAVSGPLPAPPWPPDVRYFPETGHLLQRGFLDYWNTPGAAAKLGLPVTDEIGQTIGGVAYVVQYFLNGYRLQWNAKATPATRLVALTARDWNREPQ